MKLPISLAPVARTALLSALALGAFGAVAAFELRIAHGRGERAAARLDVIVVEPEEDLLWEEASGDGWYGWVAGEAGMVRQVRAAARASGPSDCSASRASRPWQCE